MKLIRFLSLLLMLSSWKTVTAQVINTLPKAHNSESFFLYEVKVIEEFIERFNDDPQSYIRQQSISLYGTDSIITRQRLLKSLLNKKQTWTRDTTQFFQDVMQAAYPQYLSFTDSDWYAEAKCVFRVDNKSEEIPIILHIKTLNGASKWMIAGIGNCECLTNKLSLPTAYKFDETPSGDFIPTSAYGTDFVVFNYALSEKMHAADYFEPQLLNTPKAQYFIWLVKQHKAIFEYAKSISYHFFQVKNWIFTVDQFRRKESNTGWLISNLYKVTPEEKKNRLRKLLYQ